MKLSMMSKGDFLEGHWKALRIANNSNISNDSVMKLGFKDAPLMFTFPKLVELNPLYASEMASARVACKYHPDAPLIEDYRAGDLICPECGLVVGDRVIDVGSEWRSVFETKMS